MGIEPWDQPFQCQCWRQNDVWREFQKVIELENAGLSIYRHKERFRHENTNTGGLEATEGAYVFQNTRNKTMTPVDFISVLGKINVNCSRCKELLDQARILLQRISAFNDNDIGVVCDHCRTKQKPPAPSCCRCFEIIKKFKEDIKQRDRLVTEAKETKVSQDFDIIRKFIQKSEKIETEKSKDQREEIYIDDDLLNLVKKSEQYKSDKAVKLGSQNLPLEDADVFEKVQQELNIIGKFIQKSEKSKTHETKGDDGTKEKKQTKTKDLRKPIKTVYHEDIFSEVKEDLDIIKTFIQKTDKIKIYESKDDVGKKEKKESILTGNSYQDNSKKQISTVDDLDGFGKVIRELDIIRKFIQQTEKSKTHEPKEDNRRKTEREDNYLNVQQDFDIIRKLVQEADSTKTHKKDDWGKSINVENRNWSQKLNQKRTSLGKQIGSPEDLDIIGKVKRDFDIIKKFVQNFEKTKTIKSEDDNRKTKQKALASKFQQNKIEKPLQPGQQIRPEDDLNIFRESGKKELSKSTKKKKDLRPSSLLKKYDSDEQLTVLKDKMQHASQKDLTYYFPKRNKKKLTDPRAVKSSSELIRSTKKNLRNTSKESLIKQQKESNRKAEKEQKLKGKIPKQNESRPRGSYINDMEEAKDQQNRDVKTGKQRGNTLQDGEYSEEINTNKKISGTERLHIQQKQHDIKNSKLDQLHKDEKEQIKKGKQDLQKEKDEREQNKMGKLDMLQKEEKDKLEQQQKQKEEKEIMKKDKMEQLQKEKEEKQEYEKQKKEKEARKREKEKFVLLRKDKEMQLQKEKESINNEFKKMDSKKSTTKSNFKKEESRLLSLELLKKKNKLEQLEKQKDKLKEEGLKDKEQKTSKIGKGGTKDVSEKFRQDLSETGDTASQLVKIRTQKQKRSLSELNISPHDIEAHTRHNKYNKNPNCVLCMNSDLELDIETLKLKKDYNQVIRIIRGLEVQVCKLPLTEIKEDKGIVPTMFRSDDNDDSNGIQENPPTSETRVLNKDTKLTEKESGVMVYALSDRTFIDKGWTMLPTEKVVRKMNVYRMRPAHPEFDWFTHNKNKKIIQYDTGEKLAEFDDDGRGRLYYTCGNLALNYYDCEETNAQQRFVIYSSGEPDERGRSRPITVLATFDYLGNGIVFDHSGKIRLKYNQTEGVVLDKSIGPVSHWKWHTLNDPPVLQQVMIDTHLAHKDPEILKLGSAGDNQPTVDNEEMLAIEFDNFIKEKSKKLTQEFKPFQIKMKALKINEYFSLKVLDQASVYLIYRNGSVNLKLNIGMVLDHKEIVDTDTADVGDVSNNIERFPALTESLAGLQQSVANARRMELSRLNRDKRLRGLETRISVEKLGIAASRPLRRPLRTVPSNLSTECECFCKKLYSNNVYYDTNLI